LLCACGTTPRAPPPSTDIDEQGFRDNLRELASDGFEGRRPGTAGEDKTVAYLVEHLRKLGLKPGNGAGYTQTVPMLEITAATDATLTIGAGLDGRTLAYRQDMVIWTRRPVPRSELKHSQLVFVGYGIVAPEYDWDDYSADVTGKTVVILAGDPGAAQSPMAPADAPPGAGQADSRRRSGGPGMGERGPRGRGPGGDFARGPGEGEPDGAQTARTFKAGALSRYGRWEYKLEEAARHGASGVLLIHDARTAGFDWNVVANTWTGPQLSIAPPDAPANTRSDAAQPSPSGTAQPSPSGTAGGHAGDTRRADVEGWISDPAAAATFAQAGLDYAASVAAAGRPGFKPVAMGLFVDALVRNSIRRFDSSNVIAMLPGAKRSREYIVYTAHWDALGRVADRPGDNPGDKIFNGADANASGVAGLLMLAQSFVRTHPSPDRSIVFLALTGGESGQLGSAYYADHPLFPLANTVAVLNLDMLRIGGPTRDVAVYDFGNSELDDYLREAAVLQGRELHSEPNPEQGWYYRSDQFSFAARGVPALYAKGGTDDAARGPRFGQALIDDYLRLHYREPSDEYSPDWDVRGAVSDLNLYYAVGLRLAQTRRFPNWYGSSEFRAARDASRGRPRDPD
jgi:Zn-dependent M28 family amino/carboxypeptidase